MWFFYARRAWSLFYRQPVEMLIVISEELEVRVAFRFDRKLGMSFTR
jgi:hypothetical protein